MANSLVPDIMHDVLEGSLAYEIKELLDIHTQRDSLLLMTSMKPLAGFLMDFQTQETNPALLMLFCYNIK